MFVSKHQGPGRDLEAGDSGQESDPFPIVLERVHIEAGNRQGPLKSIAASQGKHHCQSL